MTTIRPVLSEDRRKRILFVQHAGAGGAAVSLSQIIAGLDRQRFEAVVLLLRNDKQAIDLLERSGAQVVVDDRLSQLRHVVGGWSLREPLGLYFNVRSLWYLPRSFPRFRRLLAELQPDLVYLNALPVFLYACPAQQAGLRVMLHVREIALSGPLRHVYRRVIERCVTHTVYIGDYEKELLAARGSADVIYNYVDLEAWQRAPTVDSGDGVPTILFAGGLNRIKGIEVLLPALALLRNRGVPFRCVCLGMNASRANQPVLKRLLLSGRGEMSLDQALDFLQRADLGQQVEFKSFAPDPKAEYAAADLVVFPSLEPHFPRPLIEAGALALPVVASDLPGPRAVVQQGRSGLLVPPHDPVALADAMQLLLQGANVRRSMGDAAFEIVSEKFNAAINEQRTLDLIDRYAGARLTAPPQSSTTGSESRPKIGVSLAVFNSREQTRACLTALLASTGVDLLPVVIDDGSSDGVAEMVAQFFPQVTLLRGDGNLWWSGATNLGIRHCLQAGCDFVLLLNPDVRVQPDTVASLLTVAKQVPPRIAAALVVRQDAPDRVWWAGSRWEPVTPGLPVWSSRYLYRSGVPVSSLPQSPFATSEVHGRAVLVPRQVFETVGLYDEIDLPQYGADVDFSHRVRKARIPMVVVPQAPVTLDTGHSGMAPVASLSQAGQGYWNYLTKRKNGEALHTWWVISQRHLPFYAVLPTYAALIGWGSVRYWQRVLRRSGVTEAV